VVIIVPRATSPAASEGWSFWSTIGVTSFRARSRGAWRYCPPPTTGAQLKCAAPSHLFTFFHPLVTIRKGTVCVLATPVPTVTPADSQPSFLLSPPQAAQSQVSGATSYVTEGCTWYVTTKPALLLRRAEWVEALKACKERLVGLQLAIDRWCPFEREITEQVRSQPQVTWCRTQEPCNK
jgi:hypothetical protein